MLDLLPRPRTVRQLNGICASAGQPSQITDAAGVRPQAYILRIEPSGVLITAADAQGHFYARKTLAQLQRLYPDALPCMQIEDGPDFANRGFMLDISRDRVPTMPTLFALVDLLSELKVNQLQLYTEHTFAYSQHRQVWEHASPMTADEVRQLDACCRERFIELVPNQNSFGHMERWLTHDRYKPLAECPEGFTFPWGFRHEGGFSLNPLDPRSLELIEGLYDELLPNFSSGQFNVGCDETFDLGLGKSQAECERRGKEQVYVEFLLKIHDAVKRRGKTMQFWGDIILHKPQMIRQLPRDMIALNWGYEADHPFAKETSAFADAGLPFYVCPGTSSWLSIAGRTDNAMGNLRSAAENGLKNGATGLLNTDWGDWGHMQHLPISFLGIAYGAAVSWCLESNRDLPIRQALDTHILGDTAGILGGVLFDLGNVYQAIRQPMGNSSRLFWTLAGGEERRKLYEMVTHEEYDDAETRIANLLADLGRVRMDRADSRLILQEVQNAGDLLIHACRRGRWLRDKSRDSGARLATELDGIIERYKSLWLARSRPGGLSDSMRRLERARADYVA